MMGRGIYLSILLGEGDFSPDPEGPPPAQTTLDPGLIRARSEPIGPRTMLSLHYCQIWDGYDYKDIWPNGCEGAGF